MLSHSHIYVETIINRGLNIVSPPEIRTLAHKNLNWQTVLRIFDIFIYIVKLRQGSGKDGQGLFNKRPLMA